MNKKTFILIAIVIVGVVILALILSKKPHESSEIKIGAILPLTGDAAQWGIPPQKGAQLAVEEINKKGGVRGRHLKLIVEDTRAEPKEGVSAFNKLLAARDIKIVLGGVASSVTLAVAPLAERNHILLASPASTNPKITNAGDFVFRVIPSDTLRGQIFAEYLFNDLKFHRVAILYINNEGGVGNRDSFNKRFTQLGGDVVIEEGYQQDATDLRSQLTKAKNSDVEAVVVVSYPQDTIILMKQARELDIGKPLYFQTEAVEDANVLREAGNAAEGATYILPAPAQGESSESFAKAYKRKYGKKPELFAAEAYDIIYLIAAAIEANPDVEVSAEMLRDYFYGISNFAGASGIISFDKNGDVQKPMAIKKIINGQTTLVKEH